MLQNNEFIPFDRIRCTQSYNKLSVPKYSKKPEAGLTALVKEIRTQIYAHTVTKSVMSQQC